MQGKLTLAASAMRRTGGMAILRRVPVWQGILVLNYHRIGEADATQFDRDLFSACQAAFAKQIAHLARSCEIISPSDITEVRQRGRGRHVLITFDDGYRDNFDLALPVLRAHGVPATFFICTGFLDQPHLAWWDEIAWMIRTTEQVVLPAGDWFESDYVLGESERTPAIRGALQRYKQLPAEKTPGYLSYLRDTTGRHHSGEGIADLWMTWEMVRELHRGGMTIGAHTVQHQLLGRLTEEEQRFEIRESRDRIAAETGSMPKTFAYPVGSRLSFTGTTKELLQQHGFDSAFSFYGGVQGFEQFDPYNIHRAHVGDFVTQPVFEAMTALPGTFARW